MLKDRVLNINSSVDQLDASKVANFGSKTRLTRIFIEQSHLNETKDGTEEVRDLFDYQSNATLCLHSSKSQSLLEQIYLQLKLHIRPIQ